MKTMTNDQWLEEATIAYYESGAQYELDVQMEDWTESWLENNGRLNDGSQMEVAP